jgi:hypothetical protein
MLTFLRKIRKSLIESGSTRKYILYAIGEIALVVIGILIALQINNWNEGRQAAKFELQLLLELKKTMERDTGRIAWASEGNQRNQNSARIVLTYLDSNLPPHDSLQRHFGLANAWWQLPISRSAFRNIEDYGMYFIKNERIRDGLNTIYGSQSEFVEDLIDRQSTYFYSTVVPVLTDLFESSSFGGFEDGYEMIPLDYEALRANPKYKNILRSNIKNRSREISRMTALKNSMGEVLEMLEEEIRSR